MTDPWVLASYLVTYGVIGGYVLYLRSRRRRLTREG
ncbi:MAG: CcmD family protein [Acidimicrobiia bacterium]|jgi:CcmD family protein